MQLQWQRFIGLCTSLKELHKSHLLFWVATNTAEKDRLGFKKRQIWPKGNTFYCSEINWGNSLQIKTPWKEASSSGEKKIKSPLRRTAGNRKLWSFHPAGFDSTASPYHEKAKRLTSAVPSFNRRRKRLCGWWATPSRRQPYPQSHKH